MKYFERKGDYSLNCVFVLIYCLVLSLMDRKTERAFKVLKREAKRKEMFMTSFKVHYQSVDYL
jgi:hypothetical protein